LGINLASQQGIDLASENLVVFRKNSWLMNYNPPLALPNSNLSLYSLYYINVANWYMILFFTKELPHRLSSLTKIMQKWCKNLFYKKRSWFCYTITIHYYNRKYFWCTKQSIRIENFHYNWLLLIDFIYLFAKNSFIVYS